MQSCPYQCHDCARRVYIAAWWCKGEWIRSLQWKLGYRGILASEDHHVQGLGQGLRSTAHLYQGMPDSIVGYNIFSCVCMCRITLFETVTVHMPFLVTCKAL